MPATRRQDVGAPDAVQKQKRRAEALRFLYPTRFELLMPTRRRQLETGWLYYKSLPSRPIARRQVKNLARPCDEMPGALPAGRSTREVSPRRDELRCLGALQWRASTAEPHPLWT